MATDPVLQRMMGEMHGTMPAGRSMGNMNMGGAIPSTEERRQAVEFMVRLLSDPQVEARIHSDPELHRMWSDQEVQARLKALRQQQPRRRGLPLHQSQALMRCVAWRMTMILAQTG